MNKKMKKKMIKKGEEKSKNYGLIKKFANQIFKNLISKDLETIEGEKITDLFEPKNFLNALKVIY